MNLAVALINVINVLTFVLYILILARILLSWVPISPWHPVVRILRAIVDPILRPFRRILPSLAGIDLSPVVAILVIFFLSRLITQALEYFAVGTLGINIGADIALLVAQLLESILIILGVLVLIRFLIALFGADPWHPLVVGVRSVTNPLVRPFSGFGRRTVHHGLDVPALLTLIAYVILYIVVAVVVGNLLVRVF